MARTPDDWYDAWERFKAQAGSAPSSLFKNAEGRAAYDALMPAPGQVRANTPEEIAATTGPGLIRGAMTPRLPTPEQQLMASRERQTQAELAQRDREAQMRYDLQQQSLGLDQQQQAQRNYMDVIRTGASIWSDDEDRYQRQQQQERAFEQQQQQMGQRAYEFEAGRADDQQRLQQQMEQRAYEFEQGRLPSERDQFEADQYQQRLQQQQQFQAQEQMARHQMQRDLMEQELSQSEKMRLQKLQHAKSQVQEQVDSGYLTAQEGRDLMTQLSTGINPLVNRQARSQMMHQEMQNALLMEQAAKQASMDQMNRQFMAKTFGERVGEWTDPDTGHKFRVYESSPGKYDVLPDKTAELEARKMEQQDKLTAQTLAREQTMFDAKMKSWQSQSDMYNKNRVELSKEWATLDQKNRQRLEEMIKKASPDGPTDIDYKTKQQEVETRRANFEMDHENDMRRQFQLLTGEEPKKDVPSRVQFQEWLRRTYPTVPPPRFGGETDEPPAAPTGAEPPAAPTGAEPPAAPQGPPRPFKLDSDRSTWHPQQKVTVGVLDAMGKAIGQGEFADREKATLQNYVESAKIALSRFGSVDAMDQQTADAYKSILQKVAESLKKAKPKPQPPNIVEGSYGVGVN